MAITESGAGLAYGSGSFYDSVLRNHYLPEVADGLNHDYVLLELMAKLKDKSMVQGKFIQHPVHTGRNVTGFGAVGYRGKLPTPLAQVYDDFQYPVRSLYYRILFTGLAEDSSATDIDSWLRAVDSEMTGARDDLARQENRICHNDGTGTLAQISNAAAIANTLTTTQPCLLNQDIAGSGSFDVNALDFTHHLSEGTRIMFMDDDASPWVVVAGTSTTTVLAGASFLPGAFQTVEAQDLTTATGDIRVVTANEPLGTAVVDTGGQREPMGLGGIVNDADPDAYFESGITGFQNIASSGNTFNRCIVLENGAVRRPITESLMQKAWSEAQKGLMSQQSVAVTTFGVRDAFADLLLTYRRHVNRTELKAGFSTVTYNDTPIVPDRDAYPNKMMLLDTADLRQHCMGSTDYRFIDEDGSIYHRLPDEHAFQAALYRRYTFGSFTRQKHVSIEDLDE